MPFVSIIVPAYNVEDYIRECVDSILAQSFTDFELLLVDDGSVDSTGEICDHYAQNDARVRVIHKENGGLVSARKAGLAEAAGEYAAYVDGDDWVAQDMFEKLCGCAAAQNTDIVIADFFVASPEEKAGTTQNMRAGRYFKKELIKKVYPHMLCKGEYFSFGFWPHVWGKVFKRELLGAVQMQVDENIKLGEDAACFYPVLLAADNICYLKEQYLYYYRIRSDSISHSVKKTFYAEEILRLLNGMNVQFNKYAEWQDILHGQLCLYACYMFENMISACLNFKTLFFSKSFQRQLSIIKTSSAGQAMIAYCAKSRTSSRAKRILRVIAEEGLLPKINLYLFYLYEKIPLINRAVSILWNRVCLPCYSHTIKAAKDKVRIREKYGIRKGVKNIVIFGTPNHGNLGDHAIFFAEKQLLERYFPTGNVFGVNMTDFAHEVQTLRKLLRGEDLLILTGGGNLGNQYMDDEIIRREVLARFPDNRVVMFPQTMYFTEDDEGTNQKNKTAEIYNRHKDLWLTARDERSFAEMKKIFSGRVRLLPDVVLTWKRQGQPDRRGALLLLRNDAEGVLNIKARQKLRETLLSVYGTVEETDTDIEIAESLQDPRKALEDKLIQIGKAELVVTDRLHGMIFSAIMQTPCVALDNYNHKIAETYKWVQELDYVRYAADGRSIFKILEELPKGACRYHADKVSAMYHEFMQEIIYG